MTKTRNQSTLVAADERQRRLLRRLARRQTIIVESRYVGDAAVQQWWKDEQAMQKEWPLAWGCHIKPPGAEHWKLESDRVVPPNNPDQ